MLVSEIFTRVRRQFGDSFGARLTNSDLVRWINDGQREIAEKNELLQVTATVPLVANTAEYDFPVDILKLLTVTLDGKPLRGLYFKEFLNFTQDTDQVVTGKPHTFTLWASQLWFFPKPDDEYSVKVFYIRQPTDIAADDPNDINSTYTPDTPEIPTPYHLRLVEFILAQAAELDEDDERYIRKMDEFERKTATLKNNEDWNQRDEYPTISVLPGEYGYGHYGEVYY